MALGLLCVVLAAALARGASAACRSDGDWEYNAYQHASSSALTLEIGTTIPTHSTDDIPSYYVDNSKEGVANTAAFLGKSSSATMFIAHPDGNDASYDTIEAAYCEKMKANFGIQSCSHQVVTDWAASLKNGNQWYGSPFTTCVCDVHVFSDVLLTINPGSGELTGQSSRKPGFSFAAHEYTHAWQKTTPSINGWMGEGEAVLMECLMAVRGGTQDWESCLKTGGGGNGILPNVAKLYGADTTTSWLKTYGEWRSGNEQTLDSMNNQYSRYVYYDAGALAILFAVAKAKETDSTKTVRDWYVAEGGFHDMSRPVDDLENVAEGTGWRKALCDFTGYSTTAEFYTAFDAFARKSEAEQLAFIATASEIATAVAINYTLPTDQCVWPNAPLQGPASECKVAGYATDSSTYCAAAPAPTAAAPTAAAPTAAAPTAANDPDDVSAAHAPSALLTVVAGLAAAAAALA